LFGLVVLFSFIVAVIASALTADYNHHHNSPKSSITGSVRYLVFVGWFDFLFSSVYLGLFLTGTGGALTSIAGHGVFLFFAWLFQLAGAGAISAAIGSGCADKYAYCSSLKALEAFSWMAWILLTFMLGVVMVIGGTAFRGGKGIKGELSEA